MSSRPFFGCPNCGHINRPTASRCAMCGTSLRQPFARPINPSVFQCPQCHYQNRPGDKHCTQCGYELGLSANIGSLSSPLDDHFAKIVRPLHVFLCHCSEDKLEVSKLHARLSEHNIKPWLDAIDLLPGQKWQEEIPIAVRNSDVVLACLSPKAINKSGYVQKEIAFALDIAQEKPEGLIFLIPVKLEECTIPNRLARLQWVNLFEAQGFERLMLALVATAKSLGIAI
ncbi:MAG: TIR domain-containing protein [Chloroflexi bacterium]|nr:TIR domain-containing protein [Chloroflexota bacterium]